MYTYSRSNLRWTLLAPSCDQFKLPFHLLYPLVSCCSRSRSWARWLVKWKKERVRERVSLTQLRALLSFSSALDSKLFRLYYQLDLTRHQNSANKRSNWNWKSFSPSLSISLILLPTSPDQRYLETWDQFSREIRPCWIQHFTDWEISTVSHRVMDRTLKKGSNLRNFEIFYY